MSEALLSSPFAYAPADKWFKLNVFNVWEEIYEVEVLAHLAKNLLKGEKLSQKLSKVRFESLPLGKRLWDSLALEEGKYGNSILFQDGRLDLNSEKFYAYSKEECIHTRHTLGHCFGKGFSQETAPRWDAFLDSLFQGETDAEQRKTLLQEWFGYLLMPTAKFQKSLIFYGTGSNGKGVLTRKLQEILGKGSRSAKNLSSLVSGFGAMELNGKYANFCSEMSRQDVIGADFKALTGGDALTGEAKFIQAQTTFHPFAKLVFSTNQLPSLFQTGNAILRRLVILELKKTFQPVVGFEEGLSKEVRGILVWALEGAKRLAKQGAFTHVPSVEAAVARYVNAYDTLSQFIESYATGKSLPLKVKRSGFCESYRHWCSANGILAEPTPSFLERIRQQPEKFTETKTEGARYVIIEK